MSGFKASLYIGGDASGAKKALAETTSAMAGARKAADTLDKSTAGLERSTKSAANANTALARGEQEVQQAVTQANTAIQQRIERMAGYNRTTASARDSAAAFGGTLDQNKASFDAMRMTIDPVYRASKQYEAVTDETRRAVAAGAVTQAEANRVLALAEAQYLATGQSAAAMARGTGVASGQLGNITSQFNDIGVMMAAGQNPIQLALQQGTQLNQVFAQMGSGRQVLSSLASAALALVNPVSLATLGIIAGGAALIQWGASALKAEDKSDALSDAMAELRKETAAARAEVELFNQGLENVAQLEVVNEIKAKERTLAGLRKTLSEQKALGPAQRLSIEQDVGGLEEELRILREALAERNAAVAAEERLAEIKKTVNDHLKDFLSGTIEAATKYVELQQSVDATVAALEAEANIQALIAQYGEDSRRVTEARVAEERRAYAATTLTADMSQTMKDEIMRAWDAANGIASVDMASSVSAAADQASRMANELGRAVSNAIALANQGVGDVERARINYEFRDDPLGRAGALAGAEFDARTELPPGTDSTIRNVVEKEKQEFVSARVEAARYNEQLQTYRKEQAAATRKSASGARGGSGARKSAASKLKKEREAVTDLLNSLQDELAILRETDPVQQEMLRHREALAGATKAERDKISELIATRNSEKTSLEEQKAAWEDYRSLAFNTFEDLRRSGGDLGSVFDTLTGKIADMATQALLLGEGPLAQFFGTANGGGLIDLALGAFMPNLKPAQALAEGGMVYGRGSGTSDQVPLWGSSGEFMVNARATAKNRTLLEMINAGADIPGFATGGMIGGAANSGSAPAQPVIYFENHSSARIERTDHNYEGKAGRGTRYVFSDAVADTLTQPGGGANRTLKNTFGVSKKRALR